MCILPLSIMDSVNSHLITIGVSSKRSNQYVEESKVKRLCKEKTCIIHCTDDNTDLVSPKNDDSWKTLLGEAEIRKHQEILEISKSLSEGEEPRIFYHRKCRSIFTMKKLLDKLSEQPSNSKTHQEQVVRRFALCLQKMTATNEIPLPDNIQPHVGTTLVWDNIDRLEATLSGEGTFIPFKRYSSASKTFWPPAPY